MTNCSNWRKLQRRRYKGGLKFKKISIISKQEILLNCIQCQLLIRMFRLDIKMSATSLTPRKSNRTKMCQCQEVLKPKQASHSHRFLSCPLGTNALLSPFWNHGKATPSQRSNQGPRCWIPQGLWLFYFFLNRIKKLSLSCKIHLRLHQKTASWGY